MAKPLAADLIFFRVPATRNRTSTVNYLTLIRQKFAGKNTTRHTRTTGRHIEKEISREDLKFNTFIHLTPWLDSLNAILAQLCVYETTKYGGSHLVCDLFATWNVRY